MIKKLVLVCVLGICMGAFAEEKVVWSQKDSIGKTKTWNKSASAEVIDNALVMKFTGDQWSGAGLNWEGYWPEDAGIKIADYKTLVIGIKAAGDAKESLTLTLKDNKHKPS